MSKSGPFDFEAMRAQLAATTDPDGALRLGRLLLEHAFGERDMMVFAEDSGREFPVEEWNEEQRRVLTALVQCNSAWPAIGFFVQESLGLEFEPTQHEVQEALAQQAPSPSEVEDEATDGPPTEEEVLAAMARLLAAFTASDQKTSRELKRLERFRPYAAVGVPFLVEQLQKGKLKQRSAAAWALSRLGPVARTAVPALLEALSDWKNEQVPDALAEIGLDDYEPLISLLHSPDRDIVDRAHEVFDTTEHLPAELVQRWLSGSDVDLRQIAVRKLRFKAAAENVPQLLSLLDDADEDVAIQARYGLKDAGPPALPAVLESVAGANSQKRRLLAEVVNDYRGHLSPCSRDLVDWVLCEPDAETRAELLGALSSVQPPPAVVVVALLRLLDTEKDVSVCQQVMRTMGNLRASEFVLPLIALAESAPDFRLRETGFQVLRGFREPREALLGCLERALVSDSEAVSLTAVWSLYYWGSEGVPSLLAKLNTAHSQRVKAEIAWALGLLEAESALAGLRYLQGDGAGLASSVAGWAVEKMGSHT